MKQGKLVVFEGIYGAGRLIVGLVNQLRMTLGIIRIDPDKRRMGLSLKGVASAKYADTDWQQSDTAPAEALDQADVELLSGVVEDKGRTRRQSVTRSGKEKDDDEEEKYEEFDDDEEYEDYEDLEDDFEGDDEQG